jgi:hypothetical protein
MIPTIKQVMKCYRVIAQIERMKTGRPGGFWLLAFGGCIADVNTI